MLCVLGTDSSKEGFFSSLFKATSELAGAKDPSSSKGPRELGSCGGCMTVITGKKEEDGPGFSVSGTFCTLAEVDGAVDNVGLYTTFDSELIGGIAIKFLI